MARRPREDEGAAWEQDADWWKRGPRADRDEVRTDDADDDDDADPKDDLVACPHCRKMIYSESVRCPECGEYLGDAASPDRKPSWIVFGVVLAIVATLLCLSAG